LAFHFNRFVFPALLPVPGFCRQLYLPFANVFPSTFDSSAGGCANPNNDGDDVDDDGDDEIVTLFRPHRMGLTGSRLIELWPRLNSPGYISHFRFHEAVPKWARLEHILANYVGAVPPAYS